MVTTLKNLALSESGFLFDPSTGHTYSLNPTAAFVLRELIAETDVADLPEAVGRHFETDVESAGRDVERFLLQLKELGLYDADPDEESS